MDAGHKKERVIPLKWKFMEEFPLKRLGTIGLQVCNLEEINLGWTRCSDGF